MKDKVKFECILATLLWAIPTSLWLLFVSGPHGFSIISCLILVITYIFILIYNAKDYNAHILDDCWWRPFIKAPLQVLVAPFLVVYFDIILFGGCDFYTIGGKSIYDKYHIIVRQEIEAHPDVCELDDLISQTKYYFKHPDEFIEDNRQIVNYENVETEIEKQIQDLENQRQITIEKLRKEYNTNVISQSKLITENIFRLRGFGSDFDVLIYIMVFFPFCIILPVIFPIMKISEYINESGDW